MIKAETAANIAWVYREIEQGEKLLKEVDNELKNEKVGIDFQGEPQKTSRTCRLEWPSNASSYRVFSVEPIIARAVIVAHLADQRAKLEKLNEIARLELLSEENHG